MSRLPVLITSRDLLPGCGDLNGRRWAGQQLLKSWAACLGPEPMALAHAQPNELKKFLPILRDAGLKGPLHGLSLIDPRPFCEWGGLFLPDPSIGRWAQWRRPVGAAGFSLIGQIHTLSTAAALGHLRDLILEPVEAWDALICSSSAGREVVESVLDDQQIQLIERCDGSAESILARRPKLPVIPLPLPVKAIQSSLPPKAKARADLDIPPNAAVTLWLGRLSLFTKLDPWPSYAVLQRVALQLDRPLVLIECGPDDTPQQAEGFKQLRKLCPDVRFIRLGGEKPVDELLKFQALAASDIAVSLVDNTQETFGLAVAEAMTAGLPVVASNWDGYRDLVRHGIDGFLVPTRWAATAGKVSAAMGWQQFTGICSFPAVAGALAQLVQVDRHAAESALMTLFQDQSLLNSMGRASKQRALEKFESSKVMDQYANLFGELSELRKSAPEPAKLKKMPPIHLDPVRAFAGFASQKPLPSKPASVEQLQNLDQYIQEARKPLWQLLLQSAYEEDRPNLLGDLLDKHR